MEIEEKRIINLNVSVDCVILGFDGTRFMALLVRQTKKNINDELNKMKLPGSLIYDNEDLNDAAKRVLSELTGLKNVKMSQFKAYGAIDRIQNPDDLIWLDHFYNLGNKKVDRIVTIAYLSLVKLDRKLETLYDKYDACWVPVDEITSLAFDHLKIVNDALLYVKQYIEKTPCVMFDLLPRKFTALQLRALYELIDDKSYDVRNFHKKISQLKYIEPLDEKQVGVSHRAARFYKFNRSLYMKIYK